MQLFFFDVLPLICYGASAGVVSGVKWFNNVLVLDSC